MPTFPSFIELTELFYGGRAAIHDEVSKLRSLVSRQKSDLDQLRAKLPGARRHRFDPSKAFQNNKENIQTETNDPLGEGNHKE